MKVRWKHDSLRLRITPTELEDLLGGEQICERLDLSDGPVWEVAIFPNAEETSLRNFGPVVHLLLSREDQKKLAYPEVQGVYFTTNPSGIGLIRYFIEKDFPNFMRLSAENGPRSWEQRNVIPGSGLRSNVSKTLVSGQRFSPRSFRRSGWRR